MKKKPLLLLLFAIGICQSDEDVVYLKNGSIVRGKIIEQKLNEYIKIKTEKNIFVYESEEIDKITKETIFSKISDNSSNQSDSIKTIKKKSIQIGLTENIFYSGLELNIHHTLDQKFGIIYTTYLRGVAPDVGYGIGIGINYSLSGINKEGIKSSLTMGIPIRGKIINFNLSGIYQRKIKKSGFYSVGLMTGLLKQDDDFFAYLMPILTYKYLF